MQIPYLVSHESACSGSFGRRVALDGSPQPYPNGGGFPREVGVGYDLI